MNIYAYVGGDPVNASDPLGLEKYQCVNATTKVKIGNPYEAKDKNDAQKICNAMAREGVSTGLPGGDIDTGGVGGGGRAGGSGAGDGSPHRDEKPGRCAVANEQAAKHPLTNVPAWRHNDLPSLRFDLAWQRENLSQDIAVGGVLGVYGGARGAVAVGRISGLAAANKLAAGYVFGPWGTIGSILAGAGVARLAAYHSERIDSLEARIAQLENCR